MPAYILFLTLFCTLFLQLDASVLRASGNPASVRKWFAKLPPACRARIEDTRFHSFINAISGRSTKHDKAGLRALVERWMDTTHTFHLPFGEMTISPGDFAYLTSIPYDRRLIEFDASLYQPTLQSEYIHHLLGFLPRVRAGTIPYGDLRCHWDGRNPTDSQEVDQLVRSFLLYIFGCTLFADAASSMDLCLLPPLRDLNSVWQWD